MIVDVCLYLVCSHTSVWYLLWWWMSVCSLYGATPLCDTCHNGGVLSVSCMELHLCDTCHDGGVLSVSCMKLHPCMIHVMMMEFCLYPVWSYASVWYVSWCWSSVCSLYVATPLYDTCYDGVVLSAYSLYVATLLCDTCHDGGVPSVACTELHHCLLRVVMVDVCL